MQNSSNLYRYSDLKKLEHTSLLLRFGLYILTFFPRVQYGKEEKKSNFRVGKCGKHHLSQLTKGHTDSAKSFCSIYPW